MASASASPHDGDDLFRVIYCSVMSIPGDESTVTKSVKDLIAWSRDWNLDNGITGALLVDNESFSQVLEGPKDTVKNLFGHIRLDKRHRDLTVLDNGSTTKREFPSWSMAYVGSPMQAKIHVASDGVLFSQMEPKERADSILRQMLYVMSER